MNEISNTFFEDVLNLLNNARKNVNKAVNLAMVYSYFEIGRKIFEEEQKGENRAEYGKYLLKELSEYESKSDERNGCQEALLGKMRITAKISTERF